MLLNMANVQLSKELKLQIEKNDASFIELKTRTQVDVDAETTSEKAPVNAEHIHVQVCKFKFLKCLLLDLVTIKNIEKNC
jgi:hypothetical protein